MTLAAASKLGPLGAGGMADMYRMPDTRLDIAPRFVNVSPVVLQARAYPVSLTLGLRLHAIPHTSSIRQVKFACCKIVSESTVAPSTSHPLPCKSASNRPADFAKEKKNVLYLICFRSSRALIIVW